MPTPPGPILPDRLSPTAEVWKRDTWAPISLAPAQPDVVALFARLVIEAEALTADFGIDAALRIARKGTTS